MSDDALSSAEEPIIDDALSSAEGASHDKSR
jgi:hypothetical protein